MIIIDLSFRDNFIIYISAPSPPLCNKQGVQTSTSHSVSKKVYSLREKIKKGISLIMGFVLCTTHFSYILFRFVRLIAFSNIWSSSILLQPLPCVKWNVQRLPLKHKTAVSMHIQQQNPSKVTAVADIKVALLGILSWKKEVIFQVWRSSVCRFKSFTFCHKLCCFWFWSHDSFTFILTHPLPA